MVAVSATAIGAGAKSQKIIKPVLRKLKMRMVCPLPIGEVSAEIVTRV